MLATPPTYVYPATVISIHDGDTVHCSIRLKKLSKRFKNDDWGFHIYVENGWVVLHTNIRLLGINCEELDKTAGQAAYDVLGTFLAKGDVVRVESSVPVHAVMADKYADRWLGVIYTAHQLNVNRAMLKAGAAAPYDGRGAVKPVPPYPFVPLVAS